MAQKQWTGRSEPRKSIRAKHGPTSKRLVFQTEDERQELEALLDDLTDEYQPRGRTKIELLDKVAVAFWNGVRRAAWKCRNLLNGAKGRRELDHAGRRL